MPSKFDRKKEDILRQLSVSAAEYTDFSPKGSVDEGIRGLVDEINRLEGYVTTSSCAGRVAIFLEGTGKTENTPVEPQSFSTGNLQGGKGGGSWLYVSHDPVDAQGVKLPGQILSLFGLQDVPISSPAPEKPCRFVHFKFEPMILHILTSSLQHAQRVYSAAMSAGFRESGIGSVVPARVTGHLEDATDEIQPIVAVRTSGLAFDSIIAYQDVDGNIRPVVSEEYLRMVVQIANDRFKVNTERTKRFADAMSTTSSDDSTWEPADIRRARKRAEGLQRRNEIAQTRNVKDNYNKMLDEGPELESLHLVSDDPA